MKKIDQISIMLVLLFSSANTAKSATFYSRGGGGAWATPATWSTVACNGAAAATFPGAADNVIICGTQTVTITVTGARACNNLTIGTGGSNCTLTFAAGAQSLAINGNLSFNNGNLAGIYTLNAVASTVTVSGTVSWTTTQGTNRFLASTGTINFANDLTITNTNQQITLSGAARVNFLGNFTDNQNRLATASACSVRFSGNYTVAGIASAWNAGAFALFNGVGKAITPNANITFGNVRVEAPGSLTSNASTGIMSIARDLTLAASSSFSISAALSVGLSVTMGASSVLTQNSNLTVARNWVNNGGTLTANTSSTTLSGYGYSIGGTSGTTFNNLIIGLPASVNRFAYTQNIAVTCATLTLETNSNNNASTYTLGVSNPTLNITGDLTIKQLTVLNSNSLNVNGGSCTVNGNLIFLGTGTSSTAQIVQIIATTGTFILDGTVTWLNQIGPTSQVATEVIQTTTGILTFNSSVSMPIGSGIIRTTGIGTINFSGNTSPCLDFNSGGQGAIYSILTTVSGGVINFKTGITNSFALTFAAGSTQNFTGTGTINPVAALRFGNVGIGSGANITAGGSFALQNSWLSLGTFTPGVFTITFNGATAALQAITRAGGETFYNLTLATGSATLTMVNNLTVANSLQMTGHSINAGGNTLTVGNGTGAALNRTAGQIYGGTYRRFWPSATAITTGTLNRYGLFPIGISTSYRPLLIASTVNTVTGGYVSVTHNGVYSVTNVSYNDGVDLIQALSVQSTAITTTGLAGGTYNIDVSYAGFNATGVLSDLKLETYTGGTPGAVGTHATTTGSVAAPVCRRTALTAAQLNNVFVAGTKNRTTTPILNYYYSRVASGDWGTVGTWSITPGGAGASCACLPIAASYVVISPGQTVNIAAPATIDFLEVQSGSSLTGSSNFIVSRELNVTGTGTITPSAGTWSVVDLNLTGTGAKYSSAIINVSGIMTTSTGSSLTMNAALNITGNLVHDGVLSLGSNALTLSGASTRTISGTGSINGSAGSVNVTTASKSILSSANLTISSPVNLAASIVLTNNGTVSLTGNLIGANSASGWTNAAGSVLNVEGALLTTGTLTATAFPNTVNYRGVGAQSIKNTTYDVLTCRTSGTKTLAGNSVVNSSLGIYNSTILDEGAFTITGIGGIDMTGTAEIKILRTVSGVFPEVSGFASLLGGTITIEQNGGTARLIGQVYPGLRLNGTALYDLSDLTQVNGNLQIMNAAVVDSIGGITISETLTYSSSATNVIDRDITAGSLFLNGGILNDMGNTITLNGTAFTHSSGTFTTTGEVKFTGNIEQYITGGAATIFNQLTIQNSSGGVTLQKPVTISEALNLVSGKLNSDATNIVTIADDATATQTVLSSFVNGPMRKVGNDEFVFPIGQGVRLGRAGISAPASASTVFTAEYLRLDYGNTFLTVLPLVRASGQEHWLLDRTGSSSGVEVTLYWENAGSSLINDCASLTVAHWNGSAWEDKPGTIVGSCSGAGRITTNAQMTNFSPFTFGSTNPLQNPLPVRLIKFDAVAAEKTVSLSWTTASESNNDFFTVERSADGVNYEEISEIDGAGNSNVTINYSAIDFNPLPGISYYRLKQTDFNGEFSYSDIVPVQFLKSNKAGNLLNIHPTPSVGNTINVQLSEDLAGINADLSIYDTHGKRVFEKTINSTGEKGTISLIHGLIPGVYFLVIEAEGLTDRAPLLIVN